MPRERGGGPATVKMERSRGQGAQGVGVRGGLHGVGGAPWGGLHGEGSMGRAPWEGCSAVTVSPQPAKDLQPLLLRRCLEQMGSTHEAMHGKVEHTNSQAPTCPRSSVIFCKPFHVITINSFESVPVSHWVPSNRSSLAQTCPGPWFMLSPFTRYQGHLCCIRSCSHLRPADTCHPSRSRGGLGTGHRTSGTAPQRRTGPSHSPGGGA